MLITSIILFAPLAACLFLLASCVVKRARTSRLTLFWRNVAVFSLFGALVYTPVFLFFLHEVSRVNS